MGSGNSNPAQHKSLMTIKIARDFADELDELVHFLYRLDPDFVIAGLRVSEIIELFNKYGIEVKTFKKVATK